MKNYLVITVGTRDVQLRRDLIELPDSPWTVEEVTDVKTGHKSTFVARAGVRIAVITSPDFPDYYTINPRQVGEVLAGADGISAFHDVLKLPLITPVVDVLAEQGKTIDTVLLIYTDQQKEYEMGKVKSFHYRNDTLFLADIIERVLRKHPLLTAAVFAPYEISKRVADIDYQYTQFAAKNHTLFDETDEVGEIFLLPQGGIDQINQAVTLQLIQAFQHKVKLYQKPDGSEPIKLNFTRYFLNDLNRQKILKHLADYDFNYIDKTLTDNKLVINLAQYASRRLLLQHNQLRSNIDYLIKQEQLVNLRNELERQVDNEEEKLIDLYLSAKINNHQRKYTEFLWKAFTLNEVLFKSKVEALIGKTDKYRIAGLGHEAINQPWIDKLNRADSRLVPYLKSAGIGLSNPYRRAYVGIFACLSDTGDPLTLYTRVAEKLEQLADKRHSLAHGLGTTTVNELNQVLGLEYGVVGLLIDLDKVFGITGSGIYDALRIRITDLL